MADNEVRSKNSKKSSHLNVKSELNDKLKSNLLHNVGSEDPSLALDTPIILCFTAQLLVLNIRNKVFDCTFVRYTQHDDCLNIFLTFDT